MPVAELFNRFLLQLIVVLATCQLLGLLSRRIEQPRVLGEIIGGILLGPSLLGAVQPAMQSYLFPGASMPSLNAVSQVLLVLFMFLIGLEFDLEVVRSRVRSVVAVSLSGVLVPLVLGMTLASFLASDRRLYPEGSTYWAVIAFLGVAMSITAFPVLARILQERSLLTTPVGTLTLGGGGGQRCRGLVFAGCPVGRRAA
jgi:Kef-type K+ transport system membrane component KefB